MAETRQIDRLGDGLDLWECDVCAARRPDAEPSTRQFVNDSGVCPRCAARRMAAKEDSLKFRQIELRDADGNLVCEEPIHQSATDEVFEFATFGGRVFGLKARGVNNGVPFAFYHEIPALRCGRSVITDAVTVWQPGVPPSPEPVLACVEDERGNRTVIRAMYARKFELTANLDACEEADYHEERDEFYCPEGWFECNAFEETHWTVEGTVLGWMPLPSTDTLEGFAPETVAEALRAGATLAQAAPEEQK